MPAGLSNGTEPGPQNWSATLLTAAAAALTGATMMRVDVVASSPGRVTTLEPTRPVAAPMNGIVRRYLVAEGDSVEAGQALAVLDTSDARIERDLTAERLVARRLERIVLDAAIRMAPPASVDDALTALDAGKAPAKVGRWRAHLDVLQAEIRASRAAYERRLAETRFARRSAEAALEQATRRRALLLERGDALAELVRRGHGARFREIDAQLELSTA